MSSTGIAAGLYRNPPYDPARGLTAVAPTVFIPTGLAITTRNWAVRTLDGFVAALKARPGAYSFGSSGIGTTGHIASANFLRHVGAQAEHVPYRGGAQSFAALLAGEVQFTHDIPALLKPFHEAGTARILFVNTPQRSPLVPDVPAAAEVGLPDYKAYSWYGLFGPASVPRPIVERSAAAVDQALTDPSIAAPGGDRHAGHARLDARPVRAVRPRRDHDLGAAGPRFRREGRSKAAAQGAR